MDIGVASQVPYFVQSATGSDSYGNLWLIFDEYFAAGWQSSCGGEAPDVQVMPEPLEHRAEI
jgi:hypothetical protein